MTLRLTVTLNFDHWHPLVLVWGCLYQFMLRYPDFEKLWDLSVIISDYRKVCQSKDKMCRNEFSILSVQMKFCHSKPFGLTDFNITGHLRYIYMIDLIVSSQSLQEVFLYYKPNRQVNSVIDKIQTPKRISTSPNNEIFSYLKTKSKQETGIESEAWLQSNF